MVAPPPSWKVISLVQKIIGQVVSDYGSNVFAFGAMSEGRSSNTSAINATVFVRSLLMSSSLFIGQEQKVSIRTDTSSTLECFHGAVVSDFINACAIRQTSDACGIE